MDLKARFILLGIVLAVLTRSPAAGQFSDQLPNASYFIAVQAFYEGQYRDAQRFFSQETRRGIQIGQARWIDSICYHAMLGEVLYHQGRNAQALNEFDQACQLLLAYPNWLLQVRFQRLPQPDANRARRVPPWGRSERQFTLGSFPDVEQVLLGDVNANRAFQQGGVAALPMLWRVNVSEVVRTAALAMRRRNELLGPLGAHDRISRDLAEALGRGNLAPANHWSLQWIDLLRGIAAAGTGRLDEADKLLTRAVVVDGRFDHPLTCVALLEQGRVAMQRGNSQMAARLLAEASFSAYYFENWDVVTESLWLGWLNQMASGVGVYPPLETTVAWAQTNRFQHIAVKLRLAQAESLAWAGQLDAATLLVNDTTRRLGEMRGGLVGIHQLYVQACVQLLAGQVGQGSGTLRQAVSAQQAVSVGNFRIARTNEMFDAGAISPRVALDLYAALLADPLAANWVLEPLEAMCVMQTLQDAAFERWFAAAIGRKDGPLAFEIAERTKRRRFLAMRPFGGRLEALRMILEAPAAALSRDAKLQRQQILAGVPAYSTLADAGQRNLDKLRAGPIVPTEAGEAKPVAALFSAWERNINERRKLVAQLIPRRVATVIEFPPLRPLPSIQKSLREDEAMIVFHALSGELFGFQITAADMRLWRIRDARTLRNGIGELLRSLGNYGPNRSMSPAELTGGGWQATAAAAFEAIFADAQLDTEKTSHLLIVPDDALWYLPFEMLLPPKGANAVEPLMLADTMSIRYGPTAALAAADERPVRRIQRTGIVANETTGNAAVIGEEMVDELLKLVPGPVRIPSPLGEPGTLVATLLDGLISLDSVETKGRTMADWPPMPRSRGSDEGRVLGLPYGGPEYVVVTGLATEAEQGLRSSRRGGSFSGRPGDEIFLPLCEMMSNGARTILLTRWRTGGRTNYELVREFVRELPQTAASEAWQRACVLARETPLDASQEPRLKGQDDPSGELPTADHPFFWAGYLLVDTSPRMVDLVDAEDEETEKGAEENATSKPTLPPPQSPSNRTPIGEEP